MFRSILVVLALMLALPQATAGEELLTVGVGEGAQVVQDDDGHYYLLATLSVPDAPTRADPKGSCAYRDEDPQATPPPMEQAALALVADIAAWDPATQPRISGWFPTCFAASMPGSDNATTSLLDGEMSYDFRTGQYFVRANGGVGAALPAAPSGIPLPAFTLTFAIIGTGTTGLGTQADCETCPPPCC